MQRLGLGLAILIATGSAALADPAITVRPTAMRAAPSPKARVVQTIPANADIDLSSCSTNWCYVSWRDRFGYVPVGSVEAMPQRRVYVAPPPVVYPGPYWGGYWGPRPFGPRFHRRW
jgi:uncharacterized protein YraI